MKCTKGINSPDFNRIKPILTARKPQNNQYAHAYASQKTTIFEIIKASPSTKFQHVECAEMPRLFGKFHQIWLFNTAIRTSKVTLGPSRVWYSVYATGARLPLLLKHFVKPSFSTNITINLQFGRSKTAFSQFVN